MTDRVTRIGLNEALFREVNERVQALTGEGVLTIVCECGATECTAELRIDSSAYRDIRSDPSLFAVARGHEVPDVEEVVQQTDEYDVVRKRPGQPERIAREAR